MGRFGLQSHHEPVIISPWFGEILDPPFSGPCPIPRWSCSTARGRPERPRSPRRWPTPPPAGVVVQLGQTPRQGAQATPVGHGPRLPPDWRQPHSRSPASPLDSLILSFRRSVRPKLQRGSSRAIRWLEYPARHERLAVRARFAYNRGLTQINGLCGVRRLHVSPVQDTKLSLCSSESLFENAARPPREGTRPTTDGWKLHAL